MSRTTFLVHVGALFLLLFCSCKCVKWPLQYHKDISSNTTNLKGQLTSGFYISINIGTPAQTLNVILDTGSSNFAIAGASSRFIERYYVKSASSSADTSSPHNVDITYVEGSWKGVMISDIVSIPSAGLRTPVRVPVTEIQSSENFFLNNSNWQGILGLAYSEIVQPPGLSIRSFMDAALSESGLRNIFSIQLCSQSFNDATYGSFVIGNPEQSLLASPMLWTPIVKERFYEVLITGMKVGSKKLDNECADFNHDKTILDSGTTNLRFPTAVYHTIVKLINDSVTQDYLDDAFYNGSKVFCIEKEISIFQWFPPLTIYLPSTTFNQTVALTIYPQSYVQFVNDGPGDQACYKFLIYPSEIGTVLGTIVMEQYYVVFDRERRRIGFAKSACTLIKERTAPLLFQENGSINSTVCQFESASFSDLKIALYVLISVITLVTIPTCYLLWKHLLKKKCDNLCCKENQCMYSELREQ